MIRSRKQLLDEPLRMDVGDDRISELPDSLIHLMISFLPIKNVVRTAVLSRRWKNLWLSFPFLDFSKWKSPTVMEDDEEEEEAVVLETEKFMNFLDRLMILRNMSYIHKFCLTCDNEYFDENRAKEWITTVVKCNVEELIVSMYFSLDIVSAELFTCGSLTKLVIELPETTEAELKLPESVSLPRVKILELSGFIFLDEMSTQQLFSNCPVLEALSFYYCAWDGINTISILAPRLKSFILVGATTSKMEFVKLKIDAPNLKFIRYHDSAPVEFVTGSFPSLVGAGICLCYSNDDSLDPLSNFLVKLSNVQLLKLSCGAFHVIEFANVLSTSFPTLDSLLYLEMVDYQVSTILKFLQFSPNLITLVIDEALVADIFFHLRLNSHHGVVGQPEELNFVKYILGNARVLEKLILESETTSGSFVDLKKKTEIMEQLLIFPRASANCEVKYSSS
ncbi:hypothetical protein C5167_006735 [Papaver somniferum]|uniref:F-box domain-containing protein n=1 Tax=Papaver somniferum TaxID=3469 RepID=A0A4Y7JEB8_PAPSO|nr:hypothetical protein C5167_006735 [Papaver somniferum]